MCGICGIINYSQTQYIEKSAINKMCEQLKSRGPDAEGYYINKNIAFGMRRLKIIDLETGDQPIFNEDKSICIIFNGEIYNFKGLKQELKQKGHHFITGSDTEAIVHLYEDLGENCLNKLRGMFAFAIWDEKDKKLFIARDRLGIKPLYYTFSQDYFIFASEIKSILAFPYIKKEIDFTAMSDYFTFLYVPAPRTIFKDIYKLLPGHYLIVKDGKVEVGKYWDLKFEEKPLKDENEYIEEFLDLFEETVRLHLISDVPLGAFLSGGTDSSLVVAMMSRQSNKHVETFSIGYERKDKYFDERKYSRIVAEKFDTNHHEFIIKPDIEEVIEDIISYFDEPFADASAIPNYLLSAETRKFVTVSLSGLGGDELCGGYERYLGCLLAEKYRALPRFLTDNLKTLINRLPDSSTGRHFNERIKRFVNSANYPFIQRYFQIMASFDEEEKRRLFVPEVQKLVERPSDGIFDQYSSARKDSASLLNAMSFIDLKTYLVDDLLTLTDRMSMAHSLETRVPFVDHKIVEFFASIPATLKVKGLTKKYLLKKAAERLIPKEVIYRKKMGFSVPLVLWFRNGMREYVNNILSQTNVEKPGYFNHSFISKIKESHMNMKANFDEKLWALINFIKWHEKYME